MTWKEFKDDIEKKGMKDNYRIYSIDIVCSEKSELILEKTIWGINIRQTFDKKEQK